jgi:hypothetical protein
MVKKGDSINQTLADAVLSKSNWPVSRPIAVSPCTYTGFHKSSHVTR